MAVPTDVKTYTAPQLAAAINAGSMTPPPVAMPDHTGAQFNVYNDGSGGVNAWRCTVLIPVANSLVQGRADFRMSDIVAAGDTPVQMFQRLFAAAKIQLNIT
jgi:hypothetical protein